VLLSLGVLLPLCLLSVVLLQLWMHLLEACLLVH
jgi:hypothetical protein